MPSNKDEVHSALSPPDPPTGPYSIDAAFHQGAVGMARLDGYGRIVDANARLGDLLGRRDLVGRTLDELGAVEARSDGSTELVAGAVALRLTVERGLAVLEDATERRRLEAELVAARRLEGMGRVASGLAHDVNNMLMAVAGFAQLAVESDAQDARSELREIADAARRASTLVRHLLAFGQDGVTPLAPEVVDLRDVVASALRWTRPVLPRSVRVVVEAGPEPALVRVDPVQLEQALVNLLLNARDAMPSGGRLSIAVRCTPERIVVLELSDSGIGMDAATVQRIFEPFFTTKAAGVGLGLENVLGAVRRSGGRLGVHSVPGGGTTFRIELPSA